MIVGGAKTRFRLYCPIDAILASGRYRNANPECLVLLAWVLLLIAVNVDRHARSRN